MASSSPSDRLMTRDALLALADRCEKASGADRELDALIADETGWWLAERARLGGNAPLVMEAERFTGSLDGAMTLVPDGCDWALYSDGSCGIGQGVIMRKVIHAESATPALALTAAALRARAHLIAEQDRK